MKHYNRKNLSYLIGILLLACSPWANAYSTKFEVDQLNRELIAEQLGWVTESNPYNFCTGYYLEPKLDYEQNFTSSMNKSPINITADSSKLSQTGTSTFLGDVIFTQPDRYLKADSVYLQRNVETGKYQIADAYGHVYIREPGRLIVGDKAHVELDNNSGMVDHVLYRLTSEHFIAPELIQDPDAHGVRVYQQTGWGVANRAVRKPSGVLEIYRGSYSTCPPKNRTWTLKANTMSLNKATGRGSSTNTRLYIHGVPIFYFPFLNFPIDDRRQTGFLFPSFGNTSNSGQHLRLPFYFNLAPNFDAIFSPDYMTERGVQLNGEFRYLTQHGHGNLHGNYLHNDRKFSDERKDLLAEYFANPLPPAYNRLRNDSDNRGFISWQNYYNFNPHWSSYFYLNRASDDYYFQDFDDDPAQITPKQIINIADLYYADEHWNFTTRLQGYQTLHPINEKFIDNQYRKIPELILNGHYPNTPYHVDIQYNSSYTNFNKRKAPSMHFAAVDGSRVNINPSLSMPLYWMSGFFNPQFQLTATQYNLHHGFPDQKNHITRVLPIFDIDSGLFFERSTEFSNHAYVQTLEPRLFYLFVPFEGQNDIPLFDTAVPPFKFDQLFRTNRFVGIDRIGDANQISGALTTRFLKQETGEEKLRASIGQIYYFENRKANIDPRSRDIVSLANSVPPNTSTSPFVGQMTYHINKTWGLFSEIAWDPNFNRTNNATVMFQFKRDNRHIFNLAYNFLRGGDEIPTLTPQSIEQRIDQSKNDLNQILVSTVWPIYHQWSGIGLYTYNISHNYSQTAFAGVQYESCCWAIRAIAGQEFDYLQLQRNNRTSPHYNNKVYLEFAFKGLSSITANSPHSLLNKNINGYYDNFPHS